MKLSFKHYSMSLVGIRVNSYPVSFGNYMSVYGDPKNLDGARIRPVNLWAENYEHARAIGLIDSDEIEGDMYTIGKASWFVVTDPRLVDAGYTNKRPCCTGHYSIPPKLLEFMTKKYK